MKKSINKNWHEKHKLQMPSTLQERVKWYEAHLKHCKCRKDVPPTIKDEFKKQGKEVCNRGHLYRNNRSCPICWPGHQRDKPTK